MKYQAYVYCIKNKLTGDFYYGYRSANIRLKRTPEEDLWIHYRTSSARVHTHIEYYGEKNFCAEILGSYDTGVDAFYVEQQLIKENAKNTKCLNKHFIDPVSGKARYFCSAGIPKSAEHRRKLSEANKGKHDDPALRERMIAPQRGKTLSEAHKAKLSKASTGFKHSEETKAKMSMNSPRTKSFLGKKHSEETKAKMALRALGKKPFLGKKHSEETKAKMSMNSPRTKSFLGKKHSEETKAKMRASWEARKLQK